MSDKKNLKYYNEIRLKNWEERESSKMIFHLDLNTVTYPLHTFHAKMVDLLIFSLFLFLFLSCFYSSFFYSSSSIYSFSCSYSFFFYRVDQIVMSKPAGGPKARNQAMDED